MKKNIFLYLLVFVALIALYLGMKGNKLAASSTEKITTLKEEIGVLKDSVQKSARIHLWLRTLILLILKSLSIPS